eukprot:CAMPEP_0178498144 /NCGR_PEP_ID=MMETSP0696-20121128/15089_1 /TAXON_ID=265572 /ORGANISM="Extubocellulus spinifer, Strain CCMP396" /LENGTH=58 /DNA_ID=CAMNT_0020126665 /DNA_START=238 /DNA_END=414 /DNA_ORIENTATION=-
MVLKPPSSKMIGILFFISFIYHSSIRAAVFNPNAQLLSWSLGLFPSVFLLFCSEPESD